MIHISDLQWFQYLHDSNFHQDIHHLPTKEKLNHLLNHLYKYNKSEVSLNDFNYYSNSLACILSMFNALNSSVITTLEERDILSTSLDDIRDIYTDTYIEKGILIELGKLAKQLEGLDHLESLSYKQSVSHCLVEILIMLVGKYRKSESPKTVDNMIADYVTKLHSVKEKHIFFAREHSRLCKNEEVYQSFYRFSNTVR